VVAILTLLAAIYKYYHTKIVQRDMDIKMEVKGLLKLTNMKVRFQYVKSHADDDDDFEYERAPQPLTWMLRPKLF